MEQQVPCRPVPAPRRLYPEVPKSEYENVTIDLINKNLNINSENIHNVANCLEKIPNNKVFLTTTLADEESTITRTATTTTTTTTTTITITPTKSILTETNDLYGPDANANVPIELDSSIPVPAPRPRKSQNNDNEEMNNAEELYENAQAINENAEIVQHNSNENMQSEELSSSARASPSSGVLRRAPEIPPKTYMNYERDRRERVQRHSISSEFSTTSSCNIIGSYDLSDRNFNNTTTSKSASNGTLNSSIADSIGSSESSKFKSPSPGYVEPECKNVEMPFDYICTAPETNVISDSKENNINNIDYLVVNSSATSNCNELLTSNESTDSDSDSDTDANDLLRSLGTTSKLLTESITERVALKAKGAKHKLDKNLKTSSDILSTLGTETTSRIKNVRQRLGTNFTLTKKDKEKNNATSNATAQFDPDRPQTLPPNDKVFNTISFSSPLNRKAGGVVDLTVNESDCSYEVPRCNKIVNSELNLIAPPTYEDALRTSPQNSFQRSLSATASKSSLTTSKQLAMEASAVVLKSSALSSSSNQNISKNVEENDTNRISIYRRSLDEPSPPMPAFPPPILPKELTDAEGLYGKLNLIQAPARQKRRKNYEQIELRRPITTETTPTTSTTPTAATLVENKATSSVSGASLRPNIDSAELHQLNIEAAANERKESLLIRERNNAAESSTPKPDRSESWEYFEENGEESDCSSPEPLYANHEATYGRVFEMASSNKDLLPPQNPLGSICEENVMDDATAGAVGGYVVVLPKEVIKEFDPLTSVRASTICRSDKSNQLLLLEHLLEKDAYGVINATQSKSDDDLSACTSEEDNNGVGAKTTTSTSTQNTNVPTIVIPSPDRTSKKSLTKISTTTTNTNQMQIVHQNAQLLSDSMENMLNETGEEKITPYLSRTDEKASSSTPVDLSRTSNNRTNWFVQDKNPNRTIPCNKLNIEDGESPPSYLEAIGANGKSASFAPNEQKSRAARLMNTMNVFANVKIHVDALKRKTSFKNAQRASDVKVTLQMVPRPTLSPLLVRYEGPLIRFPSGVVEDILKEMQNRKAILRDRQFQTFLDQDMKTPKETIPLEYITTLQCVSNNRVTDNSTHFYCFEITTSVPKSSGSNSSVNIQTMSNPNLVITSGSSGNCKQQRVSHLYGVGKESERGVWMQKILESLTNVLPPKYICHYYRAGWCYLKNSITSEWSGTWLVLKKSQRRLVFVSESTMNVEKMDLRKARCIVLKESDESIRNLHVESGPTLMIDCPPFTVYMIMSSPRETKIWRHIIREVAHNNGFGLSDQQLTKFNVPVIVDKCINFVYIHGSMSEGIYRKSGSENSILKLMAAFRADAFNVEITRNEYNEHDVANVLKRFMRDLPERLMGKLSDSFLCVSELNKTTEKLNAYKELLVRLSVIERETLKKIVGHLAFISSQKAKNKMSVQNLTMIWGPTLLLNHQTEAEMVYSQKEADVLTDLIMLYKNLFPLSADEMKKELEMLTCLQKYYAAAETLTDSVKKSGDLKMWITVNPNPENVTEEKNQINVTISPTKTAYEICQELAPKMQMSTHQISLHEVILNGNLERPLHHDTKVFDTVLSWSYWPEDDRKNNYLVVKPIEFLREIQRAVKNLAIVTPGKELKFADNRTKSFKSYQCELRDGKIVVSKKDKNDKTTIVREIFLHGAIAYLGCEKKRDFPWSWAITFVERTKTQILRSRDSPFIGHVLAGSEWVDRTIWFSSIWYCLYGDNILPPAEIIIK